LKAGPDVTAETTAKQLMVLLLSVLALPVFAAHTPFGKLLEEQKFKDYTVRIYLNQEASQGCFEILRSGKQVYFHDGQFFGLGGLTPESAQTPARTPIKMGQSIRHLLLRPCDSVDASCRFDDPDCNLLTLFCLT
jgi:hypothetical protein